MARELLALYQNGNYVVKLYSDGTKIKQSLDDSFVSAFPDSIDLKITNYCDQNCPMCHEKSSENGKHADLDTPFLKTLKKGTELAIGGGNPLSHPDLVPFLERMKLQGVICNLTINENHLSTYNDLVLKLVREKLIYGLGISIKAYNKQAVAFAMGYPNAVLHIINGIFADFDKIANKNLKILILGYKKFGRGNDYFNSKIQEQMRITKEILPSLLNSFRRISFDNLALEQLNVRALIPAQDYDEMYMGDDGESTMYIDLVSKELAKSSTSTERYPLQDEIIPMFKQIQVIH